VNLKPKVWVVPSLIAGVVFVVVWFFCWICVQGDFDAKLSVGMLGTHESKFAGEFAVLAAGAAYAVARRVARGSPELKREEWTLHAADFGAGQVAHVQRGLERHGYDISIIGLSEAGAPAKAVQPTDAIAGARLGIRDRRHPWPLAGLALLLPGPPATGQRPGFGIVTVTDADPNEGTYAEMAQYLIAALGERVSGLRFKRLSWTVARDTAEALRKALPPSPRHLPAVTRR
jgi:hypothetical protein